MHTYKGWTITYSASRTGTWRAERHGVSMCADDRSALESMIDLRPSLSAWLAEEIARRLAQG